MAFLQVVAGLAELRIAPGDECSCSRFTVLASRGVRFLQRPDVRTVNLAIEIGQRRIGANRLSRPAARGGAIEAGLALDRLEHADPLQLLPSDRWLALRRMIRVELQRRPKSATALGRSPFTAPELAARIVDISKRGIELQARRRNRRIALSYISLRSNTPRGPSAP
jgi:hypothetical protein